MGKTTTLSVFLLNFLFFSLAEATETLIRFENGAAVQVAWGESGGGIYYLAEDGKSVWHVGDATIRNLSTPPQAEELKELPGKLTVRKGEPGEPVLITIDNSSLQTPNKKSTLAVFPDGTVVNYPVDKFVNASFGTTKAGDKLILGASFDKGSGTTKVFLSPNPVPIRENGKIPNLAAVAVPGTKVLDRPELVDWNTVTVVPTDAQQKNFDLRLGARGADARPGNNSVSLNTFREAREEFRRANVAKAGQGIVVPEAGAIKKPGPPPPVVDAQRSQKIEAKGSALVFKDASGREHPILADYSKAIRDPEDGFLSAAKTFEHKDKKYSVLKIFNTREGNSDGEMFVIREDGEMVRFGFKSQDVDPKVEDGILSVTGTERQIDLDRFDMEALKQSRRPTVLKDAMNVTIDPIAEVKHLFRDLSAESRQGGQPLELLPSQNTFIDEKLRPAAAQDGGGSIAVYGVAGTGTKETVEGFIDAYVRGAYPEIPRTWRSLQLDVGALGTGTGLVGATATREQAIAEFSREIPTFWIASDFSALKGVGSSSGDESGSLSRLAPHIENGTMQLIAMTTTPGYTASIATDPRMRNLFQPAEMREPPRDEIVEAGLRWMKKNKKKIPDKGTAEFKELVKNINYAIETSTQFDATDGQPGKLVRLMKTIYAQKRVKGEGDELAPSDVDRGAISRYQADKSLFDPKLRAEKLKGLQVHLDEKLTGNTYAKKVAVQGYANIFTRVNNDRTPRNKALFAGPPGTGKSATVEISAEHIGLPKAILEMNNYVTQDSLEQFLFDVAGALRTSGYTILVLDEIEKAHRVVQAAALRMMQNGEFSARDTMEGKTSSRSNVQTSNASFQFTTNAAQDYVMDCYLGLKKFNDADFRNVLAEGGISEPILDRIDEVVPVAPFSKKTFRLALERAIARFEKEYAATPEGAKSPVALKNKEAFINDLVAHHFEPNDQKPLKDDGGGYKLVNGRLVNRIIKRYLKDPVSFERSMNAEACGITLELMLEKAATKVFD